MFSKKLKDDNAKKKFFIQTLMEKGVVIRIKIKMTNINRQHLKQH